ncbi:MAG TPA: hypothetical protein VLX91_12965 [Candidatus Acidoferrales bacterium]|nr:hypothetical protein [Candidatus Acidoferrales bacterium]
MVYDIESLHGAKRATTFSVMDIGCHWFVFALINKGESYEN